MVAIPLCVTTSVGGEGDASSHGGAHLSDRVLQRSLRRLPETGSTLQPQQIVQLGSLTKAFSFIGSEIAITQHHSRAQVLQRYSGDLIAQTQSPSPSRQYWPSFVSITLIGRGLLVHGAANRANRQWISLNAEGQRHSPRLCSNRCNWRQSRLTARSARCAPGCWLNY